MPVAQQIFEASILIVDDREDHARLIADILRGAGYKRIVSSGDPMHACELYGEEHHDLVILDLAMPGMDGFAVMERLQGSDPGGYLPVVAVTSNPDLVQRALEAGARDFIQKPLRAAEVIARVRNMLEVSFLLKRLRDDGEALERTLQERTAALRESEELFRRFAAYLPEGIFIRDVGSGTYRFFNAALERLLGRRIVVGGPVEQGMAAIHPEDREKVLDEIRRNPSGGMDREIRYLHPDGTLRWGHARTFSISDAGGTTKWIAGFVEDITERKATLEALDESQSRFRALVEQSIAGIYIVEDGRYAYANPRMCELLGYTAEELRTINTIDLVLKEDHARFVANRGRRESGDRTGFAATYRFRTKSSAIRHLSLAGKVLELQGRRVLYGIAQDMTAAVRAQELLREAETHYRALVEQSLVGIFILDGNRLLYANPKLCEVLGFTLAELAGLAVRDLVIEEDHALIDAVFERRRAGQTGSITTNCRVRDKRGRTLHLSVESKLVELAGRQAAIGIVQDITERARAAEALRESEEKYRLLWETTTDAVVLMDEDTRIRYANPSVRDVFGYAPAEVEGREIAMLQPERLREAHRRGMARYLAAGLKKLDWRATETVGLHRNGHEFPLEIAFSHLDIGGRSTFAGFMRDISARKKAHAQVEDANRRLRVLSKRVLAIQEEERRSISRELHDDVGQSLLALKIGLHRLEGHVGEGHSVLLSQCIGVTESVQDKLRELSVDLLPPHLEQLGLQDALLWLVNRQRSLTGLAIYFRSGGIERSRASLEVESACYRICQEALSNATRHSKAQVIGVELDQKDGALELVIHDNGVGFDEASQREVALASGSLGLIGMEERARLAGGELRLGTRPGIGTRVSARFPLALAKPLGASQKAST